MPKPKQPKSDFDDATAVVTGPLGLTMVGGTIPPESLARFCDLIDDPDKPPFTDYQVPVRDDNVAFLVKYAYALSLTAMGQAALCQALCVDNFLPSFDIFVGGFGVLGPIAQNLPLTYRMIILRDECGLNNIRQAYNGIDIIGETLPHMDDAGKHAVLSTMANIIGIEHIMGWLDKLSPNDRPGCIANADVMWSLGMAYLYTPSDATKIVQALTTWNATDFLETLYTLSHRSNELQGQWLDAPFIIPASERMTTPATPKPQTPSPQPKSQGTDNDGLEWDI